MNINEMKLKDISKETLIKYVDKLKEKKKLPTEWDFLDERMGLAIQMKLGVDYRGCVEDKYVAFAKLEILKDIYNDGWIPDLSKINESKYIISISNDGLNREATVKYQYFLTFKTEQLRDKFLKNFQDLIEQAKPLL